MTAGRLALHPTGSMALVQGKVYRGSARRLRRIRLRGNGSPEMGFVLVCAAIFAIVALWWIVGP